MSRILPSFAVPPRQHRGTMSKKHQKIIAIFIAYNAEQTLREFYRMFPKHLVDGMILVDDASADHTFALAQELGIPAYRNSINLGYGGNMKRAVALALLQGADIIIDLHPDGEYKPTAITPALKKIAEGAQFVLGNRFIPFSAPLKSGMRVWKFIPIALLALIDRLVLRIPLHDPHQGFRVYTRALFERVPFERNANGYLFSFEIIAQAAFQHLSIAEVPVETHYSGKKRGASLKHSIRYSLGTFKVLGLFLLARLGGRVTLFRTPHRSLAERSRILSVGGVHGNPPM